MVCCPCVDNGPVLMISFPPSLPSFPPSFGGPDLPPSLPALSYSPSSPGKVSAPVPIGFYTYGGFWTNSGGVLTYLPISFVPIYPGALG